jgi:hypothetical protein
MGPHDTYLLKSEEDKGTKIAFLLSKTENANRNLTDINKFIK